MMPEDVQYENTTPMQTVPTSAPGLSSTLEVPSEEALVTIAAVFQRNLKEVKDAGGALAPAPTEER